MNTLFDPNALFWKLISKAVDIVGLSLFWVLLSLPIVTLGPATSALYVSVTKSFCKWDAEYGPFELMRKHFFSNLKKGILVTLICELIGILLIYGYAVMKANWSTDAGAVMFVIYDLAMFLPIGMFIYIFPLIGKYELNIKGYLVNSMFLTIRHLPSSIIMVLLYIEMTIFVIEKWYPIFFAPVLVSTVTSFFTERIFAKYPVDDGV